MIGPSELGQPCQRKTQINWYREYLDLKERADWLGVDWARFIKYKKEQRR